MRIDYVIQREDGMYHVLPDVLSSSIGDAKGYSAGWKAQAACKKLNATSNYLWVVVAPAIVPTAHNIGEVRTEQTYCEDNQVEVRRKY